MNNDDATRALTHLALALLRMQKAPQISPEWAGSDREAAVKALDTLRVGIYTHACVPNVVAVARFVVELEEAGR